jgi:hypothetical protein
MVGRGGQCFGAAADLKKAFEFLLVVLSEITAEERSIGDGVAAAGLVDDFESGKRVKHVQGQKPREAEAETFTVIVGKVLASQLIKDKRRFEAGGDGPTGDRNGLLEVAGQTIFPDSIGWEKQASESASEVEGSTEVGSRRSGERE